MGEEDFEVDQGKASIPATDASAERSVMP